MSQTQKGELDRTKERIANFLKPEGSEFFSKLGRSIYTSPEEAKTKEAIDTLWTDFNEPINYEANASEQLLKMYTKINAANKIVTKSIIPMFTAKDNGKLSELADLFAVTTQTVASDTLDKYLFVKAREPRPQTQTANSIQTEEEIKKQLSELQVIADEHWQFILRFYVPKLQFVCGLWGDKDKHPLVIYDIQTMSPPSGQVDMSRAFSED